MSLPGFDVGLVGLVGVRNDLELPVLTCNCFHFGLVGLDSDFSCPDLNLLCLT